MTFDSVKPFGTQTSKLLVNTILTCQFIIYIFNLQIADVILKTNMHLINIIKCFPRLASPHNQGGQRPTRLDFHKEETSFQRKITLKRKVLSLIILSGLHRLIWDNNLSTCV